MQSLLHQLENNDAILLMYLADELSAEDRAEVEQIVAGDASMRAELDRLRAMQADTFAALGALESHGRLPVSERVAVRNTARMMRQWQIEQAQAPPKEEPADELRFPWWSYPLTTAAAVFIAFLVWWGNRADPIAPPMARNYQEEWIGPRDLDEWRSEALASELQESFDVSDEELLRMMRAREIDEIVRMYSSTDEQMNDL